MTRNETYIGELDTLHAALRSPGRTAGSAPTPERAEEDGRDGAPTSDVERVLRDLQDTLAAAAVEAEEVVAAHPLVAVALAFLLGAFVGRLSGRRR